MQFALVVFYWCTPVPEGTLLRGKTGDARAACLEIDSEVLVCAQVETRIHCPLSSMQTFWYRRLLLKDSAMLKSLESEVKKEDAVKVDTVFIL